MRLRPPSVASARRRCLDAGVSHWPGRAGLLTGSQDSALRWRSIEINLLRRQGILSQGPAAVTIDQRLESRVRDRLRSLKAVKHQPIEFKVFSADMRNDVDLRCPDDECPHVVSPNTNWSRQHLNALHTPRFPLSLSAPWRSDRFSLVRETAAALT